MTINSSELAELIEDENSIHSANVYICHIDAEVRIDIAYGMGEFVLLQYCFEQVFEIIDTSSDCFNTGCTVSVDEILDIIL